MSRLTHVDPGGRARMVDVSDKEATVRTATARGQLLCNRDTLDQVRVGSAPKGAVVVAAELAGIMAAKRTSDLVPLCHPLQLTNVSVAIEMDSDLPGFLVTAEIRTKGVTGVEMEALTAVSVACLTLFDMLKAIDRTMKIDGLEVVSKAGGKSGDWESA